MTKEHDAKAQEPSDNLSANIALVFGSNILLVLGAACWWGCHYSLLWNPHVANAYALVDGFDVRFIVTLAGTVLAFGVMYYLARRRHTWQVLSYRLSYILYTLCTLVAFGLLAMPLFVDGFYVAGLAGAVMSGIGNSVGMMLYGELHARVGYRFEPLMFAAEIIGGIVLYLVCSAFTTVVTLVLAALLSVACSVLFYLYSKQVVAPFDTFMQVHVDMTASQLAALSLLMGFTYGLIRTFSTGDTQGGSTYLGLDSECLGSCLCAFLLIGVFISQKRLSLFEQCLLFVLPLVATGMLLVTIPGVNALVPAVINTIGFACFFNLIWYFAPILASKDSGRSVTYLLALLFLICQFGQLLGSLVPVQVSGVFSSGLIYVLLLALILFMYWYARKARQDKDLREAQMREDTLRANNRNIRVANSQAAGETQSFDARSGGYAAVSDAQTMDGEGFSAAQTLGGTGVSAARVSADAQPDTHQAPSDAASSEPNPNVPSSQTVWERELGFSRRESDVAMLLIQRIPYRQISQDLVVSENTVKTHARNIYKKANVASREELIELYVDLTKSS